MIKDFLKNFTTAVVATMLYVTPVQADNICVAANFDGNVTRAKQVIKTCEDNGGDTILLMGDYSVRGIPGKRNFRTDFDSTSKVLNEFGRSELPICVLSGSNDKISDIRQVASGNQNMTVLEDNKPVKVGDLNVIPLNGYNDQRFMFEGAKFVDGNDLRQYLATLSQNPNATAVSHISPYGHIDKIRSGINVGDRNLENTLDSLNMSSISAAIRESPGARVINKRRWKINPGESFLMLETNGKGNIKGARFYK